MTTGRATKATSIARPGRSPPASTATGSRIDGPKINRLLGGALGHRLRRLDLALEDLARRPLRQLVREPDLARVLVRGHALLDERADVVGAGLLALLQHHRGADLLAERLV